MMIRTWKTAAMTVALLATCGAWVSTQQTAQPFRVLEKIDPFDYDVAPNWSLPYPRGDGASTLVRGAHRWTLRYDA